MNPANNLSDTPPQPSLSTLNTLLSSLGAALKNGQSVESLFANFISQAKSSSPHPDSASNNANAFDAQPAKKTNGGGGSQPGMSSGTGPSARDASNIRTPSQALKSPRQDDQDIKNASRDAKDAASVPAASGSLKSADGTGQTRAQDTGENSSSKDGPESTASADTQADGREEAVAKITDRSLDARDVRAADTMFKAEALMAVDDDSEGGKEASPDVAKDEITVPELVLLLQQLGQYATARLSDTPSLSLRAASGADGEIPEQDIEALQTRLFENDLQKNTSLRAFLGELAGRPESADTVAGDVQEAEAGWPVDAENAKPESPAPSLQETAAFSVEGPAAKTTVEKKTAEAFLSLFNSVNDNTKNNDTNLFVPGANAMAAGTNGGMALDVNLEGRNGTDTRDAAGRMTAAGTASAPLSAGQTAASGPYDFASQLSALRAAKGGATGLPAPVEQVVLQLSRGIRKDGSGEMTIQLRPAELGRVDVKLHIGNDGKVQGTVTADNPTTLGLLLKDARGLERALQEAGLHADPGSLQFNLRGDGQPGGFNQTANNGSGSSDPSASSAGSLADAGGPGDLADTYYLTPGGVNMRV
ncbi:MAG: flagellar hook-length control protein FliK [Bdellovibrionales bacterium]